MASLTKNFATLDKGSGTNGTTTVSVNAPATTGRNRRSTTVTFATTTAGGATTTASKTLTINQAGKELTVVNPALRRLGTDNTLVALSPANRVGNGAQTDIVIWLQTNAKTLTLGSACKVTTSGSTKTVKYGTSDSATAFTVEVTDVKWRSGSSGTFVAMGKTYPADNKVVYTPANDPGGTATYNVAVCLKIPANTYANTRSLAFAVSGTGDTDTDTKSVTLTFYQTAGSPTLTLSKTSVTIPTAGTAQGVTVTANTAWEAS